jgi:hypothetical protein
VESISRAIHLSVLIRATPVSDQFLSHLIAGHIEPFEQPHDRLATRPRRSAQDALLITNLFSAALTDMEILSITTNNQSLGHNANDQAQ